LAVKNMFQEILKKKLRLCLILDDGPSSLSIPEQVILAIKNGISTIILKHKCREPDKLIPIEHAVNICKTNHILFIVSDDILLAKSISADGIILEKTGPSIPLIKSLLGEHVIIGKTIRLPNDSKQAISNLYDFFLSGPFFKTPNENYLTLLKTVLKKTSLPVVCFGRITDANYKQCIEQGAAGICIDHYITRSGTPQVPAEKIRLAIGSDARDLLTPWQDEFDLIEKLLLSSKSINCQSALVIPPGDDASLLSSLARPTITTDTQREGVHFRKEWQTYEEIGEKAVSVTLSDLAASFATPVAVFVNLSLTETISEDAVKTIYKGMAAALDRYGCALGGGNVSRAKELSLDLFAIGESYSTVYPARTQALPGEGIYISGPVGKARAGLFSLMRNDPDFPELIHAFKHPVARFDAARILFENQIKCVMDISDGLLGDITHIARASGVTVELDLSQASFSEQFFAFSKKYNQIPEKMALQGGEDYELMFTCRPETFDQIKKKLPEAFKAGHVKEFMGTSVIQPFPDIFSFQHGKNSIDTLSP